MTQRRIALVAKRVRSGTDGKGRRTTIKLRPEIVGQNGRIVGDVRVVELTRLAEAFEVDLIAQGRQIVENYGEFIHFQTITNLNQDLVLVGAGKNAHLNGAIVRPLGNRMPLCDRGPAQKSRKGQHQFNNAIANHGQGICKSRVCPCRCGSALLLGFAVISKVSGAA